MAQHASWTSLRRTNFDFDLIVLASSLSDTWVSMAAQDFFVLGFTGKNFSSANSQRFRETCASQLFQDARFAPVLDIWNSGIQFSGSLLCEFAAAQGKERHSIHRGGSIHQISEAKVGNTVISCMFLLSANWRSLVLQRWLMSTVILLETKDSGTDWHFSRDLLTPKQPILKTKTDGCYPGKCSRDQIPGEGHCTRCPVQGGPERCFVLIVCTGSAAMSHRDVWQFPMACMLKKAEMCDSFSWHVACLLKKGPDVWQFLMACL